MPLPLCALWGPRWSIKYPSNIHSVKLLVDCPHPPCAILCISLIYMSLRVCSNPFIFFSIPASYTSLAGLRNTTSALAQDGKGAETWPRPRSLHTSSARPSWRVGWKPVLDWKMATEPLLPPVAEPQMQKCAIVHSLCHPRDAISYSVSLLCITFGCQ